MTKAQQDELDHDAQLTKELEALGNEVRGTTALYDAALKGLSVGIDEDTEQLDEYGLDARMSSAEDDVAQLLVNAVNQDVKEMEGVEDDLADADDKEDTLLKEDEADPKEEGERLAEETGEKE